VPHRGRYRNYHFRARNSAKYRKFMKFIFDLENILQSLKTCSPRVCSPIRSPKFGGNLENMFSIFGSSPSTQFRRLSGLILTRWNVLSSIICRSRTRMERPGNFALLSRRTSAANTFIYEKLSVIFTVSLWCVSEPSGYFTIDAV
jgi:hypothetical protein